jgi:hypothetical protein
MAVCKTRKAWASLGYYDAEADSEAHPPPPASLGAPGEVCWGHAEARNLACTLQLEGNAALGHRVSGPEQRAARRRCNATHHPALWRAEHGIVLPCCPP